MFPQARPRAATPLTSLPLKQRKNTLNSIFWAAVAKHAAGRTHRRCRWLMCFYQDRRGWCAGGHSTIAAELAMPDLDLIKEGETGGAGPARAVRQGPVGQSRRPAARLVVDTFVRAIETSDFERRLKIVEADSSDHPDAAAGMCGGGSGEALQPIGEICAADSLCMAGCAI